MAREAQNFLTGGGLPDVDISIVAGRCQPFPVGRESERADPVRQLASDYLFTHLGLQIDVRQTMRLCAGVAVAEDQLAAVELDRQAASVLGKGDREHMA